MYLLIEKSFELNQAWNLQSDVVIGITIIRKGDLIMLVTTSILEQLPQSTAAVMAYYTSIKKN